MNEHIKSVIWHNGLTINKCARRAGVSSGGFMSILNNWKTAKPIKKRKAASAIGICVDDLSLMIAGELTFIDWLNLEARRARQGG